MKVNKEELACIIIAFALATLQVASVTLISNLMDSYTELTKGITQVLATICIASAALAFTLKIPNSWHWQIIYDSTEDESETGALSYE